MTRSAQTDRFVHDRLPPRDQWPELRYELPELRIADQANLVERLLDGAAARGWADRPLLCSPQITFSASGSLDRNGLTLSGIANDVSANDHSATAARLIGHFGWQRDAHRATADFDAPVSIKGIDDLRLDQAAHLHDQRLDRLQVSVECGKDVLGHSVLPQPIRPVM